MDVAGRTVVITGGASGIGRALALRFGEDGARGVVIADLDASGARDTARELGPRGLGVKCDVTREDDVAELLVRATERFGDVDLFCANAGVATTTGLDSPDQVWDLVLGVNFRSHVVAVRQLMPRWLERGEGYLLVTASAAGLLTAPGDAPYTVSKHAAVAFAEWLAVTYRGSGVRVSCLCPMGVDTPMLRASMQEIGGLAAAVGTVAEPADVAEAVIQGLRDERFLITPHPEVLEYFARKGADYERWLAGMQRLQAKVSP